ncbi:MAG: MYXO-CTERM sorting domain-containing protein [Kofleriaceae bacterium]
MTKKLSWLMVLALAPACATDGAEHELEDSSVASQLAARSGPRLLRGELSAPAMAAPDEVVRGYLAGRQDLVSSRMLATLDTAAVRDVGGGSVVTMHQHHQGVPVIGGTVTARTDAEGRIRWLKSSAAELPASFSIAPAIDDNEIVTRVAAMPRFADATFDHARVTPVIVAVGAYAAAPRLSWQIDLTLDAKFRALRIFADANTAEILMVSDQVQRASEHRARIYKTSPLSTPERTDVVLSKLPSGTKKLADASFDVYNCVDRRTCSAWPGEDGTMVPTHMCSFEKLAVADQTGSFMAINPPSVPLSWADPFSELQAYYHLQRALGVLRDRLGDPNILSNVRYSVIVNAPGQLMDQPSATACVADGNGTPQVPAESGFATIENAGFIPFDEIPGVTLPAPLNGPAMFFGQGALGDYAYEGNIAYHEFGHGMFHFIGSRMTNGKAFPDELGTDPSQGGMDEAFADYFAASITGDPSIGSYVGGGTQFRSADNAKTCPNDITGEEHDDSEPFSGALWAIRTSLSDADRAAMDIGILTVMMGVSDGDDFRTVSEAIVAELEVRLTPEGSQRAKNELDARGFLTECNNRTRVLERGETHPQLNVGAEQPAPLAFQVSLGEQTTKLGFAGVVAVRGDGDVAPRAKLHIKPGTEPIRWTTDNSGARVSDAPIQISFDNKPTEQEGAYVAVAAETGKFPAGPYQMQIENTDPRDVTFYQVAGGAIMNDGKVDDGTGDGGGDAVGGCNAGGLAGSFGLLPFAALAAALRRRRKA